MKNYDNNEVVKYLRANKEDFSAGTVERSTLKTICDKNNWQLPYFLMKETVSRGVYKLPSWLFSSTEEKDSSEDSLVKMAKNLKSNILEDNIVPEVNSNYVKFGAHDDVLKIIESKVFYPIYVAGLSGNGKTFMIEQICAELKRPLVRANITKETDEDDLLGGFRLVNGETKFFEGPVVRAMRTGSILLLDEVHLAQMTIMCLQPVLEGKGVFLKKVNKFVQPAVGFNVVATANTKGKFSESGSFAGANIQDEAFLDRFAITIEQEYPSVAIEKKILKNALSEYDITDDDFVEKLTTFASHSRKMYVDGAVDEVISTRRLVNIAKAFAIFNDRNKAIEYCTNRFDESVKVSLRCFWDALFEKTVPVENTSVQQQVVPTDFASSPYVNISF